MAVNNRTIRRSICITLAVIFVSSLIMPALLRAELLKDDINAMQGWHNTAIFSKTSSGKKVAVNIDYAVYAPGLDGGNFKKTFGENKDPSNGTEYVYAYQVISDATSNDPFKQIAVGLQDTDSPSNITEIADLSNIGKPAQQYYFVGLPALPTSATWYFYTTDPNKVVSGSMSKILLFTSPYGPEWDLATVKGSYVLNTGTVTIPNPKYTETPTPEPATVLCLAMAGGLFVFVRVIRRRL